MAHDDGGTGKSPRLGAHLAEPMSKSIPLTLRRWGEPGA